MRTYLIDSNKDEIIIDLIKTIKHSSELIEFEYSALENNKVVSRENIFIRRLAGHYFYSLNKKRWKKIARQSLPSKLLNVNRVFDLYHGYKPSGLLEGADGELLTQMPGKVVKINVNVGNEVKKGQTVLILEAMKMENEIKTGIDGIVKSINCKEGEALDSGVLMMEVKLKNECKK